MIVIGGTYLEQCEFPHSEELWGPGLRGVSTIQRLTPGENSLYTAVGPAEEPQLELKSATYGFKSKIEEIPETVQYQYLHNHSNARLSPAESQTYGVELGPITGEAILRFGLIEGNAVVEGDKVVYDPQSTEAEQFHENGSEAETLALVLNQHEAREFTGQDNLCTMLEVLTTGENSADVAVIKCGTSGAIVRDDEETTQIPVYETESVWNIGSGDVFSSTFAAYWAERNLSPVEAAKKASLAAAYYCSQRTLPIPEEPRGVKGFDPVERPAAVGETEPTIYVAAPFFSVSELWFIDEVRTILLEEGAEVISPYHDIGRVEDSTPEKIADQDLESLEDADAVLALIDNFDSGTFFELGYASRNDTPIIAYKNEPENSQYTMLEGTGCEVYGDLATAVFKALWAA